ncbi:adenylosuccinate synthase [Methylobacterium oryzisoli]|uniref:adenylosuccinate synthase n=1 Tax=Methylobacterium oryzisoli TaxID=3385502 RepID=UPI003891378E
MIYRIIRIADRESAPLNIGVEQLGRGNPRLTPLAIGQLFRKQRGSLEAALAERGCTLVDDADQGSGRGKEFEIGLA